jgi:CheY-like chemotaxis protein
MVLLKSFRERFPDASVVATHSAYEALLLVGEQKPEVVTWDLNLPGTDGSRIIELLQSRRRNTSIHVALSHRHRHAELEWHAFAGPARSEKTGTGLAEMLNSLQSMIGITPARQAYPRLMQFDRTPAVPAMSHLILTD